MAYYALLDENNVVTAVFPGRHEWEIVKGVSDWEEHYSNLHGQTCLRTSFRTRGNVHVNDDWEPDGGVPFRGNFAEPGSTYDPDRDAFIPEQPFASWVLDEDTLTWEPPIPYPGGDVRWDEDSQSWVAPPPPLDEPSA